MEKDITQKIKGKGPSKIEDSSVPVPFPVLSPKISVCIFWDLEDFPFPVLSSTCPDLIYKKILEALAEIGHKKGIVSIWAYVDKDKKLWSDFVGDKTWNFRIYFVAAGDKPARVDRMLSDILLCIRDSVTCRSKAPNFVVMSRDITSNPIYFFFYDMLCNTGGANLLLYTGSDKEDYDPEKSDWPKDIFHSDEWDECQRFH